jgi:hypothetical protein
MKASARYGLLLLLVLAVILTLFLSITTPLIYSLEKDSFPSPFHNNTDALKRQSLNSSEDILPLMQELSDYAGPVIISVRLNDPEQAKRDLELFARKQIAFSNLIVKLDMTDSEMQEYSKNRALQNQLLSELVNSSVALDELKKLEVQYRDADNPAMLMSVQLEGDALQNRIQALSTRYDNATASITVTGKTLGIDTSQDEKSVSSLRQFVGETASVKGPPVQVPLRTTNLLTFLLIPEQVSYGDTLGCSGYLLSPRGLRYAGIPDRNVSVFIDNEPVSVTGTESDGAYSIRLPVERIAAGTHSVSAASGTTLSETRMLTVEWVNSVTTLSTGPPTRNGTIPVSGSVSAGVPVRNGPVEILSDGTVVLVTETDTKGQFHNMANLSPGRHVLVARFTGSGLPIRPSKSDPLEVEVPLIRNILTADFSLVILAAGGAITLIIFATGAFLYLRRMRGGRAGDLLFAKFSEVFRPGASGEESARAPAPGEPPSGEVSGHAAAAEPEPLFSRYTRDLKEHGISEAAFGVYRNFSRRIADDLQIPGYTRLTPGELSRSCRDRPYCRAFSRFVSVYETVRYGGIRTGTVSTEFETVLQDTDTRLGVEDHQE